MLQIEKMPVGLTDWHYYKTTSFQKVETIGTKNLNKRFKSDSRTRAHFAALYFSARCSPLKRALLCHTSVNPFYPNLVIYLTQNCPIMSYNTNWWCVITKGFCRTTLSLFAFKRATRAIISKGLRAHTGFFAEIGAIECYSIFNIMYTMCTLTM